jgi:hypothetical protein
VSARCARPAPSARSGIGGLTAYGTLLGDYHYDWMQRELVRPFYFTDNERLPQYTERVLRRRPPCCRACTRSTAERAGVRQDAAGAAGRARRSRPPHVAGRLRRRLTAATGDAGRRHHPEPVRRPVDGAAGVRSHELHRLLQRYPGKFTASCTLLRRLLEIFGRVDLGSTFSSRPVPPGHRNFDFRRQVHAPPRSSTSRSSNGF